MLLINLLARSRILSQARVFDVFKIEALFLSQKEGYVIKRS